MMDSCDTFASVNRIRVAVVAVLLVLLELLVVLADGVLEDLLLLLVVVLLVVAVGIPGGKSTARSSASIASNSSDSAFCKLSLPLLLFFGILSRLKVV
jgi:hypothetical protein